MEYPTINKEREALEAAKQQYADLKVKIQAAKNVVDFYENDAMQHAMLAKTEKELSNPDKRKAAMLEFFDQNENAVKARETLKQLEIEKIMVAHAVDVAEDRVKDVQAQRTAWEIENKKEIAEAEKETAKLKDMQSQRGSTELKIKKEIAHLEFDTAMRFESAYSQLNQAMQARLQSSQVMNGGKS